MGRYFIFTIFLIVFSFVGYQAYNLTREYMFLSDKASAIESKKQSITEENIALKERINFLQEPENLIKEIKSRFNFRFPDERMIIIAPKEH